ncbi:MAG: DegV family protein [Candidatus Bipolaricaulaceae bacterium]
MAFRTPIGIRYISGVRLQRAAVAGAHRVIASADQLDQINVFPVADSDTGKNLSATMWSVLQGLRGGGKAAVGEVCQRMASAALRGARGNSGVILAQFFHGLAQGLANAHRAGPGEFARAVRRGAREAWNALAFPQQGTMLSTISAFADRVDELAGRAGDFVPLMQEGLAAAQTALRLTQETLPVLRLAGVVDAGALGFVRFLEGIVHYISTGQVDHVDRPGTTPAPVRAQVEYDPGSIAFRYCTECTVTGEALAPPAVKEQLGRLGESVVVAGSSAFLHLHVHTNTPARVFEVARALGQVEGEKVDDMWAQHAESFADAPRGETALVVDTSCDLPEYLMTHHRIQIVPLRVRVGEQEFLDRVELTPQRFYERMAGGPPVGTSQPPPADFQDVFCHLGQHFAHVVALILAGDLSGTWSVAQHSATELAAQGVDVRVVDTGTLSGALGLVAWAAARAVAGGLRPEQVVELAQACSQRVRFWAGLPNLEPLGRSGRVPWLAGWLSGRVRLGLVISVGDGKIQPVAPAWGARQLLARLTELGRRAMASMERPAVVIPHAAAIGAAEALAGRLAEAAPAPGAVVHIVDASPALGVHAGIGAFGLAVLDMAWVDRRIAEGKGGQ